MLGIDPLIPGVVVVGEVVHVGEPDLRCQKPGLVGAGRAQSRVDLFEHLSRLLLDVAERPRGIRGYAAQVNDPPMDRRETDNGNARSGLGFTDSFTLSGVS